MICLDSDCIIDFLRGNKEAIEIVKKYQLEIFSTEINLFEVMYGIYMKKDVSGEEIEAAKEFFENIDILPFDENCGEESATILTSLMKKGEAIDQNDCFIASIMIKNSTNKIITKNEKHFSKIKDIKVISY